MTATVPFLPRPRPPLAKPLATALALAWLGAGGPTAHAANVGWIDWYAKTPTTVLGTLMQGNETVEVTFTGNYSTAFTGALPEPYWGPASTYKSLTVPNAPPNSDIIFIPGGPGELKLSFSQALVSPTFAIVSLGLKSNDGSINLPASMQFDRPVTVLSNGPNYYAGGLYSNFGVAGNTLTGVESSGTMRLDGGGKEIVWTSPQREESGGVLVGTYGFTIGVDCSDYRVGPATLTQAGAVPGGCRGYNDRSFLQQAGFEVRGRLDNRPGGQWVQGGDFNLAASGRLNNSAVFVVGEGKTFTSHGELVNGTSEGGSGQLDIRGTLRIDSNGAVNFGTLTLKGDNTFAPSGRVEIASAARLVSTHQVTLESASRLVVGGTFDNRGQVTADDWNAVIEVRATGRFVTTGAVTLGAGALDNRGLVEVGQGGRLVLNENGTVVPNVLNRGTLRVLEGGLLRLEGPTDPTAVIGFLSEFRNATNGTVLVSGGMELAGTFNNGGEVQVNIGGRLTTVGSFGSFEQGATGSLRSDGVIELANRGTMSLAGSSVVSGRLQINEFSQLTVVPGGMLTLTPSDSSNFNGLANLGEVHNQGTLLLAKGTSPGLDNENTGRIDNSGLFRIGNGATLVNQGGLINSGRFQIDAGGGLVAYPGGSSVLAQTSGGVFVNNGTVSHGGTGFRVVGGRMQGSGTFDGSSVTISEITFEPGTEETSPPPAPQAPQRLAAGRAVSATSSAELAASSFQTGTMRFTGNLVLEDGATVRLKVSENGGNDRLVIDGFLSGWGGRLQLVFPTNSQPGLDQVFTYLESQATGGLTLETPEGLEASLFYLDPTPEGRERSAVVFAAPGAVEFPPEFIVVPQVNRGQQRFIAATVASADANFWNDGVLGVRNLPGASLEVRSFENTAGASLLNSARVTVNAEVKNFGLVKNRAGAEFISHGQLQNMAGATLENRGLLISHGRLENMAGATLENRGLLVNGAGGRIINQGQFVIFGELRDESLLAAAGQQTITNDGGRFDIQTSGRVVGQGAYEQRGAAAVTHVDGVLQAQTLLFTAGSLGGNGRIVGGQVVMDRNTRLEPGNSVGTFTVEGDLFTEGVEFIIELAGAQSFDQLVVIGWQSWLGGRVLFRLVDGYAPQVGDSWSWLDVSDLSILSLDWRVEVPDGASGWTVLADAGGTYDTTGLLPARAYFDYKGDTLSLALAPVPEPATWALWLAGLVAVTRIARRRVA